MLRLAAIALGCAAAAGAAPPPVPVLDCRDRITGAFTIVGGVSPVTRARSLRVVSSARRIAWSTIRWL